MTFKESSMIGVKKLRQLWSKLRAVKRTKKRIQVLDKKLNTGDKE
jgi:hypothetical protein